MTLTLAAIGAALALAVAYYLECLVWPFARCGRCEGSGRRTSPDGKHWGACRRCKGSGRRLRVGRRIWRVIERRRREAG